MGQKIDAPMTETLQIGDGWQIVWAAVDPGTGADVSGVVISNANVVASDLSGGQLLVDTPILLGLAGAG